MKGKRLVATNNHICNDHVCRICMNRGYIIDQFGKKLICPVDGGSGSNNSKELPKKLRK